MRFDQHVIFLASLCFNPSWKLWLVDHDQSTSVSLWLKTKHTWRVKWASFFTELLLCSYAGTSKDYGGKAPDPSFQNIFQSSKLH